MKRRTSIQSFDWATLKVVQAEAPEIPTVYLTAQQSWLNNIDQGGTWTAGLRYEQYGSVPKMVKAAGGKPGLRTSATSMRQNSPKPARLALRSWSGP